MIETYTLKDPKPIFKYGEVIQVDMNHLGTSLGVLSGVVVGRGMVHVIDYWLVDFKRDFPSHPYNVLQIPHVAIVKQ